MTVRSTSDIVHFLKMTDSLLFQEIKRYWTALVQLIYPQACIVCSKNLELDQNHLCSDCQGKISVLNQPVCPRCATTLPSYSDKRCSTCQKSTKRYADYGMSCFSYEGGVKTILHQIKFSKKAWYLKSLKPFFKEIDWILAENHYDIIIPVPMDPARKREREYNPSELISKLIQPHFPSARFQKVLVKTKRTKPQSELNREERLSNLTDAFKLKREASVFGKTVLLVDDVVTTMSTVNECAKCLKQNGAIRVDFFSIARTIL